MIYYGTDGKTPLVFVPEALEQLGVSQSGMVKLLETGRLARPGRLPPDHPSGHEIAWLQTDINAAKAADH